MENMLDGNSAAELEYNGVTKFDAEAREDHRESLRMLRRDRQEFIDTLLRNEPATTLYKRGCTFTLRDAIDDALGASNDFCEHFHDNVNGMSLAMIDAHALEHEDYIANLFMQCKLPNEYIRLIGKHVEIIANEIFVGWDDE